MNTADKVMQTAVALASSGVHLDRARDQLLVAAHGDRTALEVARAIIMRDGLPRHRSVRPGQRTGSIRNRTLNLLEAAMSEAPDATGTEDGQYAWNQVLFDTWG